MFCYKTQECYIIATHLYYFYQGNSIKLVFLFNKDKFAFFRWRLQSAATRDHSIHSPKLNNPHSKGNEVWHDTLCSGFIIEYKKYLQTLGFMSLHIENSNKKLR